MQQKHSQEPLFFVRINKWATSMNVFASWEQIRSIRAEGECICHFLADECSWANGHDRSALD